MLVVACNRKFNMLNADGIISLKPKERNAIASVPLGSIPSRVQGMPHVRIVVLEGISYPYIQHWL